MDELNEDMLMGLPEFRKLTHLSPSSERRMRTSEEDWPPHLSLGRKVFYFRDGVRAFLDRQQSVGAAGQGCGPEPESMNVPGEDVSRRVAGLGSAAPKFSTGQLAWLRAVLAVAEGDEVADVDDPRGGADHRLEVGR